MNKKLLYISISIVLFLSILGCSSYGDERDAAIRAQRAYSSGAGDDFISKVFSAGTQQLETKIVSAILSFGNAPNISRGTINKVLGVDSFSSSLFYQRGEKTLFSSEPDYTKPVFYIVQYPEEGFFISVPSEMYVFATPTKSGGTELNIQKTGVVTYSTKELLDTIGR